MSTKLLQLQNVKPCGVSYECNPIYGPVQPGYMIEYVTPCNSSNLAPPQANLAITVLKFDPTSMSGNLRDLILEFTVTNTQDDSCTFGNPYTIFSSMNVYRLGVLVDQLNDMPSIRCRTAMYFRKHQRGNELARQWSKLGFNSNTFGNTLSPLVFNAGVLDTSVTPNTTTPTVTQVRMSLLPLLYYLYNTYNLTWSPLEIQLQFTPNTNTPQINGGFNMSSDTVNSYGNNLSYTNIQIRSLVYRMTDPRLTVNPSNSLPLIDVFTPFLQQMSFANVYSDKYTVRFTSFPSLPNVLGMYLWIDAPVLRTSYNSVSNGQIYSTPAWMALNLRLNGLTLFSYGENETKQSSMVRYLNDVQQMRFGDLFNEDALTSTNIQNLSLFPCIYVDFCCIENYGESQFLSGVNTSTNLEVDVVCVQNLSSIANLHAVLHTQNSSKIVNGNAVRLLNPQMNY